MNSHEETQYLSILQKIIDRGHLEQARNGNTLSTFGETMRFSLSNGQIPILTTKKTAWKTCLKELLWFIRGETDNRILKEQNVHIWDANGTREFLNSRGLYEYEIDELGPIYGYQWRSFNAKYYSKCQEHDILNARLWNLHFSAESYDSLLEKEYTEMVSPKKGIDQLQQIIDALKDPTQRNSRRLIMTAWNPCQLDEMCLPPCHILCQFNVHDGNKLSCCMFQRSADFPLGVPFNIASYAFLTHLIAHHCHLIPHEFIHFIGNAHIYEPHLETVKTQIKRQPLPFPTLSISQVRENIEDYQIDDFVIHNYQHHPPLRMPMIA